MPNPYRGGRRPRARKLRMIEFFGILLWLNQAATPVAVIDHCKTMAADLACISSGVAMSVLAISILFQTGQVFSRQRNGKTTLDLVLRMLVMLVASIMLSLLAVGFSWVVNIGMESESYIGATLMLIDLAAIVYFGLQQDNSFQDILVVFAWLVLAILAGALLSKSLALSAVLYSSVLTLWTYYYLLCDIF